MLKIYDKKIKGYVLRNVTELDLTELKDKPKKVWKNFWKGVKAIGDYCFSDNNLLLYIDISKKVKYIGEGAFFNCRSLKDIDIPDSVEYIGPYAFKNCVALEKITLPKKLKKLKKYTFFNCVSLKTLKGESLSNFEEGACAGCTNLEKMDFQKKSYIAGYCAFAGCNKISDIYVTKVRDFEKNNSQTSQEESINAETKNNINKEIDSKNLLAEAEQE